MLRGLTLVPPQSTTPLATSLRQRLLTGSSSCTRASCPAVSAARGVSFAFVVHVGVTSFVLGLSGVKRAGIDPKVSGTTAVVALVDGSTLHVANCGDSRGIIVRGAAGDAVVRPRPPALVVCPPLFSPVTCLLCRCVAVSLWSSDCQPGVQRPQTCTRGRAGAHLGEQGRQDLPGEPGMSPCFRRLDACACMECAVV